MSTIAEYQQSVLGVEGRATTTIGSSRPQTRQLSRVRRGDVVDHAVRLLPCRTLARVYLVHDWRVSSQGIRELRAFSTFTKI